MTNTLESQSDALAEVLAGCEPAEDVKTEGGTRAAR